MNGAGALKLVVVNDPPIVAVRGFALAEGISVCGRSQRCDLVIPNTTISRRHAQLRVATTHVDVVDLASRNGTFVDGRRVQTARLELRQVVQFGDVALMLAEHRDDTDWASWLEDFSTGDGRSFPDVNSHLAALSAAQSRVLELVMQGLVEKQIARRLAISRHTAHNHIRSIYQVFDVHSRAELLSKFVRKTNVE